MLSSINDDWHQFFFCCCVDPFFFSFFNFFLCCFGIQTQCPQNCFCLQSPINAQRCSYSLSTLAIPLLSLTSFKFYNFTNDRHDNHLFSNGEADLGESKGVLSTRMSLADHLCPSFEPELLEIRFVQAKNAILKFFFNIIFILFLFLNPNN